MHACSSGHGRRDVPSHVHSIGQVISYFMARFHPPKRALAFASAFVLAAFARGADASFLSGDALDSAADVMSWVILVLVPAIGITVFWIVHVMPEKIAHKRHHPQAQAIHTLCLLSLVFGGLLWPIAWLWAYTRPVGYKLAYGTEHGDSYFDEMGARARAGELPADEMRRVRDELDAMHARGTITPALRQLREELAALPLTTPVAVQVPPAQPVPEPVTEHRNA